MSFILVRRAAAAAALVAVMVCAAFGQSFRESESEFDAAARKTNDLRKDFFSGKEQPDPKNKDHMTAIDHAAKGMVYRLHWVSQGRTHKAKALFDWVYALDAALAKMSSKKLRDSTLKMQHLFSKAVMDRCADVITESKPIAAVNAARMMAIIVERKTESGPLEKESLWAETVLPRLAEGNADHYVETVVKLLEHKKANDGVRYYLLRGLANLLALPAQETPLLKKESEEKALRAALAVVVKEVKFPKATPREEVEGYKVLRQQAVAVLAGARSPSLGAKERPALALARVAAGAEGIVPAPRVAEQIEATIGLARVTARSKDADYQADYAAEQIARGVLAFALEADMNLDSGILGVKDAKVGRARAWMVDAARLLEAVELLKGSKNAYVRDVVSETGKVLKAIEVNRTGGTGELGDWIVRTPAPAKSLFKSDPETIVKPAEPAAKEKEKEKPKGKPKEKVDKAKTKPKGKGKT